MSKQDKLQSCVLRVNIQCACDGCKQKIKKLLKKVDGVYQTSIDLDQGKVTVYGNADPNMLIKKLVKSGKHAEIWGQPKGGVNLIANQFKNMGFDNKGQKGGGGGGKDKQKDGKGHQQMQPIMTGFKDIKAPNKDQKSVKFSLPAGKGGGGGYDDEDDFDDDSDFDDEFDDEYDDEDDDSLDGYEKKPNKMMAGPGMGGKGPPVVLMDSKKGSGGGFEVPVQFKGKGGNNDAKNGKDGKKGGGKDGKKSKDGGKSGGFLGGLFGGGKKKSNKGGKKGHDHGDHGHKNGDSLDKKSGGKQFDEGKFKGGNKQTEFLDFSKPQNGGGGKSMGHNGGGVGGGGGGKSMGHNGGGGGGGGGARNMGPMGGGNPMMSQMGGGHPMSQMGGGYPMSQMQSTQGLPMGGHYRPQGMEQGNPYSQQQFQHQQYQQQQQQQQQQYMHAMMMNQQQQQRASMYPPQMMYGQPSAFGPPNAYGNDGMTHIFNDENTESCSIM